jgi:hypothetical protein
MAMRAPPTARPANAQPGKPAPVRAAAPIVLGRGWKETVRVAGGAVVDDEAAVAAAVEVGVERVPRRFRRGGGFGFVVAAVTLGTVTLGTLVGSTVVTLVGSDSVTLVTSVSVRSVAGDGAAPVFSASAKPAAASATAAPAARRRCRTTRARRATETHFLLAACRQTPTLSSSPDG